MIRTWLVTALSSIAGIGCAAEPLPVPAGVPLEVSHWGGQHVGEPVNVDVRWWIVDRDHPEDCLYITGVDCYPILAEYPFRVSDLRCDGCSIEPLTQPNDGSTGAARLRVIPERTGEVEVIGRVSHVGSTEVRELRRVIPVAAR